VEAATDVSENGKQNRHASELNHRVAERITELAKANDELKNETGERGKIEARLLETEAVLQKAFDEIKKSEAKTATGP
jgi:C4-dicarboxylate-specific signal transduction histidine kinase